MVAVKTMYMILGVAAATLILTGTYLVFIARTPGAVEEGKPRLVVYTYDSLFAYGADPNKTRETVFTRFEQRYGCVVELHMFDSSGEALSKVIEEVRRGDVKADVILGLDNVQVIRAKQEGVLEMYRPENLSYVPPWLVDSYDPELYAVPFDYGIIALVYNESRLDPVTAAAMKAPTLEMFMTQRYSDKLIVENPTTSSTGQSFLLYEIALTEKILNTSWEQWWRASLPHTVKSWGDAFDVFYRGEKEIMVSYGTDPAYGVIMEGTHDLKASLITYNGTKYAWLQIEGAGIVKGAPHRELAEKFIEWLLSVEVQKEIPLGQWMYPVNTEALHMAPREFLENSIDPENVTVLNTLLPPSEIAGRLDAWLETWLSIASGERAPFSPPPVEFGEASAELEITSSGMYYVVSLPVSGTATITSIYVNGAPLTVYGGMAFYASAQGEVEIDISGGRISLSVNGTAAANATPTWIRVHGARSTILVVIPLTGNENTITVTLVTRYGDVAEYSFTLKPGKP